MEEEMVDCFSNIQYTPAWYWKKFPGFLNVECYKILVAWDKGVRTKEEVEREIALESATLVSIEEKCMEEENYTEKRKLKNKLILY